MYSKEKHLIMLTIRQLKDCNSISLDCQHNNAQNNT